MNVSTFRLAFLLSYLHCKLCISRAFGRPIVVLCCENCGQQCGYITAMFGRRVLPVFALCPPTSHFPQLVSQCAEGYNIADKQHKPYVCKHMNSTHGNLIPQQPNLSCCTLERISTLCIKSHLCTHMFPHLLLSLPLSALFCSCDIGGGQVQ